MSRDNETTEQGRGDGPEIGRVRLLALDVDGVLTDGSLYLGADGEELKRFSIVDGLGIRMFMESGLHVAIISGHDSEVTRRRFERLGVSEIHVGVRDKGKVLAELRDRLGLEPREVAAMGDDLVDIPLLMGAGFRVTVPQGHQRLREMAHHVTERPAGLGAVREVVEMILQAQGKLQRFLEIPRP